MPTSYLTLAVLHDTFGAPSIDPQISETSVDIDLFLESINAEVDSYVAGAITLPPIPAAVSIVRGAAADIARYRLFRDAASDLMRQRFEDALQFLSRVAARKIVLPVAPPDPADPDAGSVPLVAESGTAPRQAQRQQLRGWW